MQAVEAPQRGFADVPANAKEDSKKAIRIRAIVTVVGVILAIALTIWGEVS